MKLANLDPSKLLAQVPEATSQAVRYADYYFPMVQMVAGIFSAVLAGFCIYLIVQMFRQNKTGRRNSDVYFAAQASKKRVLAAWQTVKLLKQKGGEVNLKLAVLEADKILDEMLQAAGFAGETLGERLKSVKPGQMENLNEVWRAHKVRNRIAHEAGASLRQSEAEEILNIYHKVFTEFGLLRE